jgi:uncharacterized protein (TIGR03435 family)
VQVSAQSPTFEVFSIKPSNRDLFPSTMEEEDPCSAALLRLTGRTLSVGTTTLQALIAIAYNPWKQSAGACAYATKFDLISGAPNWIRSDRYAIQALLPDSVDPVSYPRLLTGDAPDLQRMLQAALTARFNLIVRTAKKELPVYLLVVDQNASIAQKRITQSRTAGQGIPERYAEGIYSSYPTAADGGRFISIMFKRQRMNQLTQRLASAGERPVVDRTGLAGEFDFILEFDESGAHRPTLSTALREQLGLRLQPSRGPVDVLVVERAERPSGN